MVSTILRLASVCCCTRQWHPLRRLSGRSAHQLPTSLTAMCKQYYHCGQRCVDLAPTVQLAGKALFLYFKRCTHTHQRASCVAVIPALPHSVTHAAYAAGATPLLIALAAALVLLPKTRVVSVLAAFLVMCRMWKWIVRVFVLAKPQTVSLRIRVRHVAESCVSRTVPFVQHACIAVLAGVSTNIAVIVALAICVFAMCSMCLWFVRVSIRQRRREAMMELELGLTEPAFMSEEDFNRLEIIKYQVCFRLLCRAGVRAGVLAAWACFSCAGSSGPARRTPTSAKRNMHNLFNRF